MAYIRTKQIPPGEGNYYKYLVKGSREGDKVKQKVLQYLGRAESQGDRDLEEADFEGIEEENYEYLVSDLTKMAFDTLEDRDVEITKNGFIFTLALDRNLMSIEEAREVYEEAIERGYIEEGDEFYDEKGDAQIEIWKGKKDHGKKKGSKGEFVDQNFSKLSRDRKKEKIEEYFKEEAEDVWDWEGLGEELDVEVFVGESSEEAKKDYLAGLGKPGKGQAIGDSLVKTPKNVKLKISPRLMKENDVKKIRKLMKHEAIHLGYGRHTEDFYKVADSEGAPISEKHFEKGYIEIQEQDNKGERYETVDKVQSYKEAKKRARELGDENPDKSYRLNA